LTPVLRFLKRQVEHYLGSFYEGPEPPRRLRRMVLLFANAHPKATRREWAEFAAAHAAEAYQSGYTRGWERSERDADAMPWLVQEPEIVADALDPGWRDGPNALLVNAEDVVVSAASREA
jgi:hypothetical protein